MSRVKMRVTNPKVDGPPKRLSRKKNTVQPALAYRRVTMRLAEPLNSFGRVNPTYTKAKLKPILISPRITPITPASSRLTRRAEAAKNTPASPLDAGVIGVILGLISIGFSLAFVYVGFTLPKLLRGSASRIVTLLYASAGWTVFFFLLSLLGGPSTFGLVTLILTLLILWYLLKNVRRLAAEAQAAPSEPPPSGTC